MENVQPYQIIVPICMVLFIGIMLLIWGDRPELAAWIRSWFDDRPARYTITSSYTDEEEDEEEPVLRPVPPIARTVPPDTNAIPAGRQEGPSTPAISRRMTEVELIAVLAVQRKPDSQYRFSANQIAALIGGKREDVLAHVRAIRNLPRFPDASPTEQATIDAIHPPVKA